MSDPQLAPIFSGVELPMPTSPTSFSDVPPSPGSEATLSAITDGTLTGHHRPPPSPANTDGALGAAEITIIVDQLRGDPAARDRVLRALQPPAVSFAESSCGSRGRLAPSLAEPSCGSASSERRTVQPELSRTTSLESVSFYPKDDPRYGTVVDRVTRRRMEAAVVTIQLVWKQRKLGYDACLLYTSPSPRD